MFQMRAKVEKAHHVPFDFYFSLDVRLAQPELVEAMPKRALCLDRHAELGGTISELMTLPVGKDKFAGSAYACHQFSDRRAHAKVAQSYQPVSDELIIRPPMLPSPEHPANAHRQSSTETR